MKKLRRSIRRLLNSPAQRSLARRISASSFPVWRAAPALCGLLLLIAGMMGAGTLAAADTSFYIAPCTDASTGCEPGDLDLARWARSQ